MVIISIIGIIAAVVTFVVLFELVSRVVLNWQAKRWVERATRKLQTGELKPVNLEDRKYGAITI
ncbi:MAG: hypothetical protein C0404_13295, partial [Verrucomicrobia bacterium]|nr:hypothetical protein [Verrucomicrobiota bacterium]